VSNVRKRNNAFRIDLKLAAEHMDKISWRNILWWEKISESKGEALNPKRTLPSVNHGHIMLWGCFTCHWIW